LEDIRVIAKGLRFPEGPVWMSDGSVALVEIERGTISIVAPDGRVSVLATPGGGPNGLAVGPDGAFYVCNNGGFIWIEQDGKLRPSLQPPDYSGGRIERVHAKTGAVTLLYDECAGHKLRGPNDIVFDAHGGFYFTDLGKSRARDSDHGGVYYALANGTRIARPSTSRKPAPHGSGRSTWKRRVWQISKNSRRRMGGGWCAASAATRCSTA
jgi:gluconolactonase